MGNIFNCGHCTGVALCRVVVEGKKPPVIVLDRCGNSSAFNGYRWQPSDYSAVLCVWCGRVWRTKAKYIAEAPDAPDGWISMELSEICVKVGVK